MFDKLFKAIMFYMLTVLITLTVFIVTSVAMLPFGSMNFQRVNGEKIGIFTKIDEEGTIYRTNEGQIIRGGINQGSGSFGQTFDFTIPNNMLEVAQKALDSQKAVKISYRQPFWCWRALSENRCIFVNKIETR